MNYLVWSLIALASYTIVSPLISFVTRDVPSSIAALITNGMLAVAALGVVLAAGESIGPYLSHDKAPYMYLAGIFLTIGILAYYRALALGPVSIVVPIFGLFIVTSSAIGIAFLDESLTARKVAGIAAALVAIYLTSVE